MSKINAVRFINLNYNNNAIKISDEIFHLNGQSSLLSLRNGGGKSVLVQMMTAPFVHKRYRDAKDRPFESYFTTNRPTFILVEWVLDQGAGYVLTGMMVRRSQNMEEEQSENLDIINFISEYREPCLADIHHLPVVEREKKKITLKNFMDCRRLFEDLKRDRAFQFFCYDMGNFAQSRQYFEKLLEYQINYKEWETIIKKINLEESGLSNLFADCRDERGLVEKWFLEAVEGKINREKNRIKEFQSIVEKYVGQYRDNQFKIKRRDTIKLFREHGDQIEELALKYQAAEEEKGRQELRIGGFIKGLRECVESLRQSYQQSMNEMKETEEQIAHIQYEKLSSEYHKLKEEQYFHIGNQDMIEMEQEELVRELNKVEERLHLLLCAGKQSALLEEKADWEEIRQKLTLCQRKNEDLAPERDFLGYLLREHYEKLFQANEKRMKEESDSRKKTNQEIILRKEKMEELEQAIRENASKEGALKSSVRAYDSQEESYNKRYQAGFVRNIMGNYEPGFLEITEETYRKEREEAVRQQGRRRRSLEDTRERIRELQRDLEDTGKRRQQLIWDRQQREKLQTVYEEELAQRLRILAYLEMKEEERFDTDTILAASDRKLQSIARLKRNLEKEEDGLQKEYHRLTQGRVLELSGEMEQELADLGIHVVYGMEWLKRNGYKEKRNRELVKKHPLLPYALILSERDLEKLSAHQGGVYTSAPIPVIKREELEKPGREAAGSLVDFKDISFYVYFNENLLNEERLADLVKEKEYELKRKQEAIAIREQEYREYFERREMVRNQAVSREAYVENEKLLKELAEQSLQMEESAKSLSDKLAEAKETGEGLENDIKEGDRALAQLDRQLEDFAQLCGEYEAYIENYRMLEKCQKELANLTEKKTLYGNLLEKLQEELKLMEIRLAELVRQKEDIGESLRKYASYGKIQPMEGASAIEALTIQEQEARFKAITSSMSEEIKSLEEQELKALKRLRSVQEELERLRIKYGLEPGAWEGTEYSVREEEQLEIREEDYQKKIENKKFLWNEEKTKIQVLGSRLDTCLKQIEAECGQKEALAKEDIQDRDFDAAKKQLEFRRQELKNTAGKLNDRLQCCEENLTALAEYSNFAVEEQVESAEGLLEMNREQMRERKGILIRDYKKLTEDRWDVKEHLAGTLNRIMRIEAFGEEFYQKPLEAMLELVDDASQVLRQLSTTIQSYDSLMEKLSVDIAVVEKEKEKIVELMEDYVKEVHTGLGRIDGNSTITIHGRPLKMLKLLLPDWGENEGLYHLKLEDMLDGITKRGIEIFERNENAQEYFGTQITTRNIYDTVIGIGNVQIKLYKIEEQREYPITWADVAKNSGGEGFLSAFVILSSLLYYMRRDDTDLFANWNEGKVLVMDNPFAQTNASHLLKPLMDVAEKANTQLICLTGLGGESIYNRFENIYVLNLIAASLRNGMQYLKTEHVKGGEPEVMVLSQIEVVEQMELEF